MCTILTKCTSYSREDILPLGLRIVQELHGGEQGLARPPQVRVLSTAREVGVSPRDLERWEKTSPCIRGAIQYWPRISTFLSCAAESYDLLLKWAKAAVDALNLFLLNLVRFCRQARKVWSRGQYCTKYRKIINDVESNYGIGMHARARQYWRQALTFRACRQNLKRLSRKKLRASTAASAHFNNKS